MAQTRRAAKRKGTGADDTELVDGGLARSCSAIPQPAMQPAVWPCHRAEVLLPLRYTMHLIASDRRLCQRVSVSVAMLCMLG